MKGHIQIGMSIPARGRLARETILSAVETLARANVAYLLKYPDTPPLALAGVEYRREKTFGKGEKWQTIPEVLRNGHGDCEDLSAYRIAELRVRGIRAFPHVVGRPGHWHIQVKAFSGDNEIIYDPSKELGM